MGIVFSTAFFCLHFPPPVPAVRCCGRRNEVPSIYPLPSFPLPVSGHFCCCRCIVILPRWCLWLWWFGLNCHRYRKSHGFFRSGCFLSGTPGNVFLLWDFRFCHTHRWSDGRRLLFPFLSPLPSPAHAFLTASLPSCRYAPGYPIPWLCCLLLIPESVKLSFL